MEMKVLWGGAFFFIGWLFFYLFVRQFIFNFTVANSIIKKMKNIDPELISSNAYKYTAVSIVAMTAVMAIATAIIIYFCKTYMVICYAIGIILGLVMFMPKLNAKDRSMFEIFCGSYYRFVPDDELRTAMYNKDDHRMKLRLKEMGKDWSFIPKYDETK